MKYTNLSGDEFIEKILAGERDFKRIMLPEGCDLTKNESYSTLTRPLEGRIELVGSTLAGIQAPEIYLSNANLSHVDLSHSDLHGANLRGANLSCSLLTGANLSNADLSGANLSDTYLRRANLSDAILDGSNLHDALGYHTVKI
tara:strand:+ start:134 stop:565 length:432 start_codon:yes stop_codon:yes gene_type:complete